MTSEKIIEQINAERDHQNAKYGGEDHDDLHTPNDWVVLCARYATAAAAYPACNEDWTGEDAARFRKNMIRVAAIAVAAVEYVDRQEWDRPA